MSKGGVYIFILTGFSGVVNTQKSSFGSSLFQKAGSFQRQRLWSPDPEGEILPVAPRAQPKTGKKAARRPPVVPAAAISKKLRHDALLIYPKRNPAPASRSISTFLLAGAGFVWWAGGAGLRPVGNPLIGFPSVRQPTGLSDLPFLIFWVSFWRISLSAESEEGRCPSTPPAFWEKAGPKTFLC